jgi:tetratricopeptide (TPR) repeat protein
MPFRARLPPGSLAKRRLVARVPDRQPRRTISTVRESFFSSTPGPSTAPLTAGSTRHKSTTTTEPPSRLTAFSKLFSFGNKKGKSRARVHHGNAREEFQRCCRKGDVKGLIEAYDLLVEAATSSSGSNATSSTIPEVELPSAEDMVNGMTLLASSEDVLEVFDKLEQMYHDTERVFGLRLGEGHHSAYALGLCKGRQVDRAVTMLEKLNPEDVDWSQLLELAAIYDGKRLMRVWRSLRKAKTPDANDYFHRFQTLRRGLRKGNATREQVEEAMEEMEVDGVDPMLDQDLHAALVRIWWQLGENGLADQMIQQWEAKGWTGQALGENARLALFDRAIGKQDTDEVVRLALETKEAGHEVPGSVPAYLVNWALHAGVPLESAVRDAETKTLTPIGIGWRYIFQAMATEPWCTPQFVIDAYRFARRSGTDIDADIGKRAVSLLLQSPEHIDDAVEVYEDVIRYDVDLHTYHGKGNFALIAMMLLRASAICTPPRPDVALRALEEMAARGIDAPDAARELCVLIKHSPNHEIGYKLYDLYAQQNEIGQDIGDRFINAFLQIEPPADSAGLWTEMLLPPSDLFFAMLRDMRQSGLYPGKHAITSLITRYGLLATKTLGSSGEHLPKEVKLQRVDALREAITKVHTRIKLDPTVEPDIHLLNALMGAYNRVGAINSAVAVLDDLIARRRFVSEQEALERYPAVVATALDLLSFARMRVRSEKFWAWARRHNFATTTKIWNDRVQSLCRLQQWDEAVEMVCVTMKDRVDGAPAPDVESLRILAKYLYKVPDRRGPVLARLQETFPQLWEKGKGFETVNAWRQSGERPAQWSA